MPRLRWKINGARRWDRPRRPGHARGRSRAARTARSCRSRPGTRRSILAEQPDRGQASLNESAEPCDRLADDERVHLARAFIGIDGFRVGDKATDVIFEQDAVAAQ